MKESRKRLIWRITKCRTREQLIAKIERPFTNLFYRKKFNTQELIEFMKSMGLKRGCNIFLHSSWSEFYNYTGTINEFIDAILDVIGKEGTLIMPAYPLLRNENSIFDVRNTPTGAGLIAEEFRHYPGVKRSLNRQHSVCALGPMSDFLLGEHHMSKTCWDEKSPYYKLGEINAIVFTLGLGKYFVGTMLHCAESILCKEDPYFAAFFTQEVTYKYRDYDGNIVMHTCYTKSMDFQRSWSIYSHNKIIKKYFDKSKYKRKRFSNLSINVYEANYFIKRIIEIGRLGKTVYTKPDYKKFQKQFIKKDVVKK